MKTRRSNHTLVGRTLRRSSTWRLALLGWLLAAIAASGCGKADAERVPTADGKFVDSRTQAERIARGRQISYSSACHDCHSPGGLYGNPDSTRAFSGSELAWEGPWGVTYPRNLTPDTETGIASWTEDDIVRAFRTGVRPNGTALLPPMPWGTYSHMSDEDAYALAAYIKSLPPIRHKAPDRLPPGSKLAAPHITIPAPPEWDGRHLAVAQ